MGGWMHLNISDKLQFVHNIDLGSTQSKFLIMLAFILVVSFLIDYLLSHSFLGKSYRIFAAPGVIVHELAHAALCVVTRAKITKISLFDKEGGSVQHSAPKIPLLGQILISLAPFAFGAAGIYFLSRRLGIGSVDLTAISVSRDGILNYFQNALSNLDLHNIQTWIIIYLVLSIAVTMTPSLQDLRNIFLSIIFIAVVIFLIYHFTSFRFHTAVLIPNQILTLFSTVSLLLILSLFLSIILYILSKIFKPV